jgi:hypothetical protein
MKSLAIGIAFALSVAGAAIAAPNQLTPAEKAAGWKLLYDGKSLAGWRGFKAAAPDKGWTADGALSPDAKTSKDIITKDEFENFELTWQWKISPKGNSGLMFHVLEVGDETYESGPEYQILDNAHGEKPPERAAALYALYPPSQDVPKPVGEWNDSRLVVDHGKVQHWLNGVKVVEYEIGSPDFKARVDHSKFRQWPQFASGKTGHIALQNHGNPVWFRDLKIRVLK